MNISKNKARGRAKRAVDDGTITVASDCEACGSSTNVVLHHWSYREEDALDVIPMCRSCHGKVHRGSLPEPRTGRIYDYRPSGLHAVNAGLASMLSSAARAQGWNKPADLHRALLESGIRVSLTTVRNWWHGRNPPAAKHVPAVAALLGLGELSLYRRLSGASDE